MEHTFKCPYCGGKDVEVVLETRQYCKVVFDEKGWPNVGEELLTEGDRVSEWRCADCFNEFTPDELRDIVTNTEEK